MEGAEILNQKHKNAPKWITYLVAFTALENYLKSYLLSRGKTLDYIVEEIGYKLQVALAECETLGLDLRDGNRPFIEKMMELSRVYTTKDFQFARIGNWELFPPSDVIFFVGKIRDKIKAQ